MSIHNLPFETVEEILLHADPIDISALSQTSRLFNRLVYNQGDQHLWRWLYLSQDLDDPRECLFIDGTRRDGDTFDWQAELQAIMRARTILEDCRKCRPSERCTVLATLIKLVEWMPPQPIMSRNLIWVGGYLADGRLIDDGKIPWTQSSQEVQLRAKLHTYYGQTPEDNHREAIVRSRSFVYDFRHYNWATEFGPYLENGTVDWEFLRAIRHSVAMHVDRSSELKLTRTQIALPSEEDWSRDWAGVEGEWECGFCFCDHLSLMEFNQSASSSGGRLSTILFEDPDNSDVYRSIKVKLRILKVREDPRHPRHPRIDFGGDMGSLSSATMSGHVCMTNDNQVRWRFLSGELINPIWSSEGIQVGGLRSSYGVLGTWTTSFHHSNDPVGPFWLRRADESEL